MSFNYVYLVSGIDFHKNRYSPVVFAWILVIPGN